jgi:hypothetical protein
MFTINTLLDDLSIFEALGYVTLLQLWWIAIWGIAYIAIEYVAKKSKIVEFYIYCGLLTLIIGVLLTNPILIKHL